MKNQTPNLRIFYLSKKEETIIIKSVTFGNHYTIVSNTKIVSENGCSDGVVSMQGMGDEIEPVEFVSLVQ